MRWGANGPLFGNGCGSAVMRQSLPSRPGIVFKDLIRKWGGSGWGGQKRLNPPSNVCKRGGGSGWVPHIPPLTPSPLINDDRSTRATPLACSIMMQPCALCH